MVVPLVLALGAPVTLVLRTLPPPAAALAARRAALAGGEGAVLPAADLPAVRDQPVGALLLRLVRRDAALDAPARADARAPGAWSARCSSGRWSGIDPVPGRVAYPFRLLLVVLTLPFHAFLGVTIMSQEHADRRLAGTPTLPMGLAARPRRRPAPRRRHPVGLRRPGRAGVLRRCCSPSGCARRCARRRARTGGSTCSRRGPVAGATPSR